MSTRQKAASSACPEILTHGRASAATQREFLFKHATTQVSSCGLCEWIFLEVENDCKQECKRCDQVNELLWLMAELQEEVVRLRTVREFERDFDQRSCTMPSMMYGSQLSMTTAEVGPGSGLCQKEGKIT